jgi:hypothetical protein
MKSIQKKPRTGRNSISPTMLDNESRLRSSVELDRDDDTPTGSKKKGSKRSNSRGAVSSPVPNITTGIPKNAKLITTLPHGEVVCTVSFNAPGTHVFSGGKVLRYNLLYNIF